jgi:hypothetical protein
VAASRLNVTDPVVRRALSGDNSTVFKITPGAADALLMTAVPDTNLAVWSKCQPPDSIVEMLASAPRPSIP